MKEKIIIEAFKLQNLNPLRYAPGVPKPLPQISGGNPYQNGLPKNTSTPDPYLYISLLGTPVFADLDISNGSYIDNNGNTVEYPGIFIDTVLMDVSRPNIIIKDKIQGLDGSIKEFISADDWMINVKGVLIGGTDIYPKQAVADLYTVLCSKLELQVNSWFLTQFGISHIVIESFKFPQEAGLYGQQLFEFSAVSDTPVTLYLSPSNTST